MREIVLTSVLIVGKSSPLLCCLVFVSQDEAHQVLKVRKRANQFLEEIHSGNLERECFEETCSFEEAKEIFKSQEKTTEFWFHYKGLNPCKENPCKNGGLCKLKHYDYLCICPPLFQGKLCETEKLECWYKNGGCWQYCQDAALPLGVVCSCAQGDQHAAQEVASRPSGRVEQEAPKLNAKEQNVHDGLTQTDAEGNLTGGDLPSWTRVFQTAEPSDTRVTGGSFCHRGNCPWQVFIQTSRGYGVCGGSLISSRWVVTAAHCLDIVRPHHVTVGDFDKHQREVKEQKLEVQQSWVHPHYDSDNYNGDIALLYLSSDVVFNEYVLPICLPSPNLATLLTAEGTKGMVSGWGSTHARGPGTRFLMKVKLPIVSMETCRQSTAKLITDNMFCAGYADKAQDACKGDSGGPFAVSYRDTWYLLGIVSWGEGCAEAGKYGAYTRVANYVPWIKEVFENVAEAGGFLPSR
uniref:Coagulation factor VII n=1 Tax=Pelodiscus sinensis TaxID=13735 RepID=K7F5M9_PELSI